MSGTLTDSLTDIPAVVDLNHARPSRWGWLLLLAGLGSFLVWASVAPLDGAVPAQGTVVVSGSRKVIQPLSSGKVMEILVKDGDQVKSGQVLVRLDETQSRAQLEVFRGQWMALQATQARLEAEQSDSADIDFPASLMEWEKDARLDELIEVQSRLLHSRRQMRRDEIRGMQASVQGLELQMQGLEASRNSKDAQLRMLREELRNQRALSDEGYYPRNRVSEQERAVAALIGSLAEDLGNIGKVRQAINELRARIAAREQESSKEIGAQLADAQRDAAAIESRLKALEFDLANTEIRAPVDGTVMSLALHTIGGVVAAGAPMLEVMPRDEPLTIEVQLQANLIDKVRKGMDADILFTAFNQATTPRVAGRVVLVAPDASADTKQGGSYFKLNVEVDPANMSRLKQYEVRAGMPVEVFVKTGERTFMTYLFKPLLDRMNHALIEP